MAVPRSLQQLARLHGVQTAYMSNERHRVTASADALMAALRALGVSIERAAEVPDLLEHRLRELWDRVVPPVVAVWVDEAGGPSGQVRIRLPVRLRDGRLRMHVTLEEGGERVWTVSPSSAEVSDQADVDGAERVELCVPLPELPVGYHGLAVDVEPHGGRQEALLIAAPRRAAGWDAVAEAPSWGVFAPLYALHRRHIDPLPDARVPTFYDLATVAEIVAGHGGAVVGTLPLLAAFLDRPYEPSPYAPVSRLFWNELYTDPRRVLDRAGSESMAAFAAWAFPGRGPGPFEREDAPAALDAERWADRRTVDPGAGMRLRRPLLEALAARFFHEGDPPELAAFRSRNPEADDYARFRAVVERRGDWHGWPDRLRARDLRPGDYDDDRSRYHLFVQYLAERQLAEASEQAAARGVGLYLDLPLGVHPSGYDVWRERVLFAGDASAGAPPDPLAAGGQDWGFPPLQPEANRLDRYRYFIACIRKHLRFARVLRIDHVMQLHRMFWVVTGDAREGVYVRQPADELYAILCLESRRAGAVIVGEDLGTVPRTVRRQMRRHGVPGMYVAQFELTERETGSPAPLDDGASASAEAGGALVPRRVTAGALASIGTHDTPTFAGWWWGRDIEIRRELGQIDPDRAEAELAGRAMMRRKLEAGLELDAGAEHGPVGASSVAGDAEAKARAARVVDALHRWMGRSAAGLVLATMEDLWLETEPQNVPGTTGDRNWQRRMARPLEALREPGPARWLESLNQARRGSG